MRGESDIPFERTGGAGLTPAYAGRIIAMNQASLKHWVDPRACGENRHPEREMRKDMG